MKNIRLLILLLLIHLFFLVNLRFTAWPEMLSFPYLLNKGFSLYQDMVHPYPPLLTIILSRVFLMFGYSVTALKIVTWSFILINDIFIWLIVTKLTKSRAAAFVSVLIYVLTQPFLEGNMMWVDLGFVPFVLGGLYLSLDYYQGGTLVKVPPYTKIVFAGLLFVLASFIKQTAVLFGVVVLLILVFYKQFKEVRYFLIAPLFVSSMFVLKLYAIGDLLHFLNWTVLYPTSFWTKFPGYVDMTLSNRQIAILSIMIAPLLGHLVFRFKEQKKNVVLWFMFLVSLLVVYPRFSFFHLQSALAIGAILMGVTFGKRKQYAIIVGIFVLLVPLVHRPTIVSEWRKPDRFSSKFEQDLAREIQSAVPENNSVFLLNIHSMFYASADRLPAKPWIDNYGWYYEISNVQESLLSVWRESSPDYILWKEADVGEWYELGTYEPQVITSWIMDNYSRQEELQKGVWLWKFNEEANK